MQNYFRFKLIKTQLVKAKLTKTKLISTLALVIITLSGCAVGKLNYQIDPEITGIQQLAQQVSLISVSVVDARNSLSSSANSSDNNFVYANGPENAANTLKSKLIDNLKKNKFKIISNPLLADLAIKLQIEDLEAKVTSDFFKSSIQVTSYIRLKANKKRLPFEKLFKTTQTQSVAKPAKSNEVTGVVNQVLSQQLSDILSDPELLTFAEKDNQ